MLAKSCAVSATHSCGSCAPIGCIVLKPGISRSTPRSASRPRDARVGLVGRALRRRPRVHHLPRHRHAVRRILRQELVQDRRAGARQADDEERALDAPARRSRDARACAAVMRSRFSSRRTRSVRAMTRPRSVSAASRSRPSSRMPNGVAEAVVAEVVEPRRGARARQQRLAASRRAAGARRRAARAADAVQQPEPERAGQAPAAMGAHSSTGMPARKAAVFRRGAPSGTAPFCSRRAGLVLNTTTQPPLPAPPPAMFFFCLFYFVQLHML